jgi:hypothetical protein
MTSRALAASPAPGTMPVAMDEQVEILETTTIDEAHKLYRLLGE